MNIRRCFIIGILLCGIGILNAQVVITSEAEQRAKEIVAKMTLKEKLRYISGYTGGFSICPVPSGIAGGIYGRRSTGYP